jgi:CRP/FNR family nitrogen fixation transcriptional regulator
LQILHTYQKDEEIYGRGDAATFVYQVVIGSVRTVSTLHNRRRQVGAFYFPGDIFGLDTEIRHLWGAEAIEITAVRRVKRRNVIRKAQTDLSYALSISKITERDLLHAEDHGILLGQLNATERTVAFLLEIDKRIGVSGEIRLMMRAEDVAGYLGIRTETFSRVIARLLETRLLKRHGQFARVFTLGEPKKLRAILPPTYALEMPSISEAVSETLFS